MNNKLITNILLFLAFCSVALSDRHSTKSELFVVELVRFNLMEGITNNEFLNANKRVEEGHVSKQPGFISRTTAVDENGDWLVIVHWVSLEDAEASMKSFENAPATAEFMKLIDASTMSMKRYSIMK